MSFTYSKKDKLKSKKHIDLLFKDGKTITVFPLRLVFLSMAFNDDALIKAGVSVSKRIHKKAVVRNRIKRLLREAYRLNKPKYFNKNTTSYAFMILYLGKNEPDFKTLNKHMGGLFKKFLKNTEAKN